MFYTGAENARQYSVSINDLKKTLSKQGNEGNFWLLWTHKQEGVVRDSE